MEQLIICKNCQHRYARKEGQDIATWTTYYCLANPTGATKTDYVTGEIHYPKDYEYKKCNEVNTNGNCSQFSRKLERKKILGLF